MVWLKRIAMASSTTEKAEKVTLCTLSDRETRFHSKEPYAEPNTPERVRARGSFVRKKCHKKKIRQWLSHERQPPADFY